MSAPLPGFSLQLFRYEHVKVPFSPVTTIFPLSLMPAAEVEGKRRGNQIVQVDGETADVQESVAATVGRNIAADDNSTVIEAAGNQGKFFESVCAPAGQRSRCTRTIPARRRSGPGNLVRAGARSAPSALFAFG